MVPHGTSAMTYKTLEPQTKLYWIDKESLLEGGDSGRGMSMD